MKSVGQYDSMILPGSGHAQCPACSEYFYSVTSFDAHRVGKDVKRCKTVLQMQSAGMSRTEVGHWIGKSRSAVQPSLPTI